MKNSLNRIFAGIACAALIAGLTVPASAAETPPADVIRVGSYKGSTLEVGERSGLMIGPSGTEYTVTSSDPDTVAVEQVLAFWVAVAKAEGNAEITVSNSAGEVGTLTLTVGSGTPAAPTVPANTSRTEKEDVRQELVRLINQTRRANGVAELPVSDALMDAAQVCSDRRYTWHHTPEECQAVAAAGYQSISNYKRSLRAAFFIAIEDDCVRKNPFSFALNKVLDDDRGEKTVLTPEQETSLIDFMQNDPVYQKYADEIIILLGTGLRISEFCGLTTNLDFKNRLIRVDHQLLRDSENGYYIETPKTKSGYREIPMSEPVYQALKRVLKNRGKKPTITVDGYTGFLFLNREGLPKVGMNYNNMVRGLVKKYNKHHKEPLPNITPHSIRHTFCSRMANAGMNPKALQYIMGHANITMTLDYYTHVDACSVKAEMERLAA